MNVKEINSSNLIEGQQISDQLINRNRSKVEEFSKNIFFSYQTLAFQIESKSIGNTPKICPEFDRHIASQSSTQLYITIEKLKSFQNKFGDSFKLIDKEDIESAIEILEIALKISLFKEHQNLFITMKLPEGVSRQLSNLMDSLEDQAISILDKRKSIFVPYKTLSINDSHATGVLIKETNKNEYMFCVINTDPRVDSYDEESLIHQKDPKKKDNSYPIVYRTASKDQVRKFVSSFIYNPLYFSTGYELNEYLNKQGIKEEKSISEIQKLGIKSYHHQGPENGNCSYKFVSSGLGYLLSSKSIYQAFKDFRLEETIKEIEQRNLAIENVLKIEIPSELPSLNRRDFQLFTSFENVLLSIFDGIFGIISYFKQPVEKPKEIQFVPIEDCNELLILSKIKLVLRQLKHNESKEKVFSDSQIESLKTLLKGIKNKTEFLQKTVVNYPMVCLLAQESLDDIKNVLELIKINPEVIQYLPFKWQKDESVIKALENQKIEKIEIKE